MYLLKNFAEHLEFEFHVYIVGDGLLGTESHDIQPTSFSTSKNTVAESRDSKCNGTVSVSAHMWFAALSVSSAAAGVIDIQCHIFSVE
jgi:hypothetical protein